MSVDERALRELIVESQDLHTDALRDQRTVNLQLAELQRERRSHGVDRDELREHAARYNAARRRMLRSGGLGLGAFAARGALATAFGGALAAIVAGPAAAQEDDIDVMVLQTAASLENLAVATYGAALDLPFIADGNEVVRQFAETTLQQHDEHGRAFNDNAESLGGERQTETNPRYQQVVDEAMPGLTDPAAVVELAMTLEDVATQTYNNNITLMRDNDAKALMASVMGVESQHFATLAAVGALLGADAADLIAIPTDVAALPAGAGSVAFPDAYIGDDLASPPEEGAVA